MKKLIAIAGLFALIPLAGCGASQPQKDCLVFNTAVCAGLHDPSKDRTGFSQCVADAAKACGLAVSEPSPVPSPVPPITSK